MPASAPTQGGTATVRSSEADPLRPKSSYPVRKSNAGSGADARVQPMVGGRTAGDAGRHARSESVRSRCWRCCAVPFMVTGYSRGSVDGMGIISGGLDCDGLPAHGAPREPERAELFPRGSDEQGKIVHRGRGPVPAPPSETRWSEASPGFPGQ